MSFHRPHSGDKNLLQLFHLTDLSKTSLQNLRLPVFLGVDLATWYIRAHQLLQMHKPTFKSYLFTSQKVPHKLSSLLMAFTAWPRHMQL